MNRYTPKISPWTSLTQCPLPVVVGLGRRPNGPTLKTVKVIAMSQEDYGGTLRIVLSSTRCGAPVVVERTRQYYRESRAWWRIGSMYVTELWVQA